MALYESLAIRTDNLKEEKFRSGILELIVDNIQITLDLFSLKERRLISITL
jgi:hypothetical protein